MENQAVATGAPIVMAQPRPRIGPDSFRALAERLKKPITVAPQADDAPAPVVQDMPVVAVEPIYEAAPEPAPVAVEIYEPPVAAVDPITPQTDFTAQSAPLWNGNGGDQAAAPREPEFKHMQWSQADSLQSVVPSNGGNPFEAALPAFEPTQTFVAPPVIQEQHISPLQRVLASEPRPASAPAFNLPEILAAPAPLPVVEPVDPASLEINIEPPTMAAVTERLKEDATNRLLQLDIENIWRQVLAKPTLEERTDYLREAAEFNAAENGGATYSDESIPEEFDLSLIETANEEPAIIAPESATSEELVIVYSDNQPDTDVLNAEQQETAELARSLLDMMASGSSSGLPQERALAADTLLRLLPKLALKPLIFLSQRLSMMDNPPHLLVAKLIRDDRLQVSGPLLEDCAHITDQDLIMVVDEEHSGKRRMIARRRHLSRAVCDKLITTKDPSVLLTMVRNANAEISNDGFGLLTILAADMPDLMAPLSTRADLSAPNAFELFWPAPAQLRRYLLNRFLTDSETLTKILKITLSSTLGTDVKESSAASVGELTEMLQMACAGRLETASSKLADVLGLDPATVHRILCDREGEAIIVMLKTLGFPRSIMGDLLPGLKRGDIPVLSAEREVSELQTLFDTLSNNKARILITYWDWAVRKAGPYAPVH